MILDMVSYIFRWFVRRFGGLTLIRIFLLWIILICLAQGLITVVGNLSAGPLANVVLVGLFVGWLMGKTRLPGWFAALFALG
jgi:hypothetical protein